MTIDELEKMEIVGDAYHDQRLFDEANKIIMSDAQISDKIRAIKMIDKATGVESSPTEQDVLNYIKEN